MQPDLDIIYKDEYFVAVHKPEGLLVHKSNIDKHETVFLLQELRNQIGQHLYPVHRLDKPTSGLILFALTPEIAKIFKKYSDEQNIKFCCSVFNPEAVETLENLNVKLYKIASWTAAMKHKESKKTLETIAETKKPVIISTGMGGDVNRLKQIFRKNYINYFSTFSYGSSSIIVKVFSCKFII